MTVSKENITTLLFVLVAILVTLQITSMLKGSHPNEKAIRNEIKLEQLEEKRITDSTAYAIILATKDSLIAVLKNKNITIVNQTIKQDEKLKNIPAKVNNLSVDSLLRSAINY